VLMVELIIMYTLAEENGAIDGLAVETFPKG
jgi:hypothetical protein